jgi:hypothetical protein
MTPDDALWVIEPNAWSLDRLAWEDDEEGFGDLDERPR